MDYQHTQTGYLAVLLIPGYIAVGVLLAADSGTPAAAFFFAAVFMAFTIGLVLVFSRLTVVISRGRLRASFGIGWPKKEIDLSNVKSAEKVRNHWYEGFGIRKVRHGWMYNVWGLDAVELELEGGAVVRIGTNDPDGLHAAIALRPKA